MFVSGRMHVGLAFLQQSMASFKQSTPGANGYDVSTRHLHRVVYMCTWLCFCITLHLIQYVYKVMTKLVSIG